MFQQTKLSSIAQAAFFALSLSLMAFSSNAAAPKVVAKTDLKHQSAASSPTAESAWALYSARQYSASADLFEVLLKAAPVPDARLLYYAALANRESGRTARSSQIFQYIVDNFPSTPEATCCKTALEHAQSLIKTADKTADPAISKNSKNAVTTDSALASPVAVPVKEGKKMDFVFTPDEIAKEGAHGIDQSRYPNCWFEASMSALAQLPRGQRLLANMVRYGEKGAYLVRFPGDGKEYVVTKENLETAGIRNKALWASLIECAENRKYPANAGLDLDQHRLEIGLNTITGCKCELIRPYECGVDELSSFIGGAIRSQSPVVCGTSQRQGSGPHLIMDNHAYTVIGFDASRNMVTLRNPHGMGAQRFSYPADPQHLQFEQLDDGVFKMSLPIFKISFGSLARSFI